MNKSTKGVIAAVAGVTLLTGVGGTFANWSENGSAAPGTVTAGHLTLTVAPGTWSDITTATPKTLTNISAFRMVPGDVVRYTTTVTPDLLGDNLTAKLTATLPAGTGTLADDVTVVAQFDGSATAVREITEANDDTAIPITVTVTMPFTNTLGEDEVLNLSSLTVDLVQNANPVV
ncbi:alternate-type signal peptide domain-containing protein [Nocardioides sp. CF8]|uniref:alternate-type signal peptide domain-containing protein n=1 Tax=Nocardioides sp. CF8 TaxID=110319 RepID=UPI00041EDE9D|nr:alternate-type signal peptide domain-containing protein [Nocardioides sp. CF8]